MSQLVETTAERAGESVSRGAGARRWRPGQGLRIALLLAPALAIVVLLYGGGLVMGLLQSFGWLPFLEQRQLGGAAYGRLFADPGFLASLQLTFRLSLTATVVSAVLAVGAALLIRSTRRGRRAVTFLFQLNLPVPHIVGGAAMLLLLAQSGTLARIATSVGLIEAPSDFPPMVNDRFGWGILAEYIWKEVPFIGIVVLAALRGGIGDYEEVASTLGASAWQRFRYVILPMVTPAVLSTSIIVFAFTFGSFEIPFLLGQPFPTVLPVLAYRAYNNPDLSFRADAMAISMIIALLISALVLAYLHLSNRYLRAER
jgi:putative spermidine/putrescine transport system permease protein